MSADPTELERFIRGEIDAAYFPHREHVRMAYLVLQRYEFTEAALRYTQALRAMTARAGRPEKFNTTVTLASLALIAARMADVGENCFDTLVARCPELLDRNVLSRWYRPEQLNSPLARRSFLLPEPAPPLVGAELPAQ